MDVKTGVATVACGPRVTKYNVGRRRARLPSRSTSDCLHFTGRIEGLCSMLRINNAAGKYRQEKLQQTTKRMNEN
jgi:hypothetical protein